MKKIIVAIVLSLIGINCMAQVNNSNCGAFERCVSVRHEQFEEGRLVKMESANFILLMNDCYLIVGEMKYTFAEYDNAAEWEGHPCVLNHSVDSNGQACDIYLVPLPDDYEFVFVYPKSYTVFHFNVKSDK